MIYYKSRSIELCDILHQKTKLSCFRVMRVLCTCRINLTVVASLRGGVFRIFIEDVRNVQKYLS